MIITSLNTWILGKGRSHLVIPGSKRMYKGLALKWARGIDRNEQKITLKSDKEELV